MNKSIKTSLGLIAVCGSMFLMACGNENTPTTDSTPSSMDSSVSVAAEDSVISYDISLVNNKKDPTCGMPVTAGISDTAHYDNKVVGFCSAGCKEEFLKNPKANIAAAEMK
jgi:YHS domain-containing protein